MSNQGRYVITLGRERELEHGNRGLWTLLGYEEAEQGNQNPECYMEHVYQEDRKKYLDYLAGNTEKFQMSSCEYRLIRKDGTVIDVLDTMEMVRDSKGVLHGYAEVMDITERKSNKIDTEHIKNSLQMSENEIHDLLKFGGILSFKYNVKERYCPEYENLEEVMHYTPETFWKTLCALKARANLENKYVGNLYYLTHEDDRSSIQRDTDRLLRYGTIDTELRFLCGDGAYHWFKVKMYVSQTNTNIINGYFYNIDDKAEEFFRLKETLENEKEDNSQLYRLLNFAGILFFEYDVKNNAYSKYVNIESVMQYTPESYKETLARRRDPADEYGKILGNMYYLVHEEDREIAWRGAENLRHAGEIRTELRFLCGDGKFHWFKIEMDVIRHDEKIIGYMTNVDSKINEIRSLQQRVVMDPMTGVFNKLAAFQRFDAYIEEHPGNTHALLVVDVDDFKQINDKLGHTTGDKVLVELSDALKSIFRRDDIIGRFGGDEFIVFVKNISSMDSVLKRARQLQAICSSCECLRDTDLSLSISIGAAYSRRDMTGAELFKTADKRLYKAKNTQKGTVVWQ